MSCARGVPARGGRSIPRAATCIGGRGVRRPGPCCSLCRGPHPRRPTRSVAEPWCLRSGHVRLRSDGPAESGWCGPDQGARPGLPQTPGGRALHPVIVAASTGNIAGTRQAALIVGDRVIKVAPRRRPAADREPAVLVTHLDQVPHPGRGSGIRRRHSRGYTGHRDRRPRYRSSRDRQSRDRRPRGQPRGPPSRQPPGLARSAAASSSRRVRASLGGGRWLIQESDRHRDGDPPEHAGSGHPGSGHPGSGHPGAPRARTCRGRVSV